MDLSNLPKLTTKSKKRVGRGYGSGRGGHTSSRGAKGQKARNSVKLIFEGSKLKKSWVKRLPFIRGKGKFKPANEAAHLLNLEQLSVYKKDEKVDIESLIKKGILPENFGKGNLVKILNKGEIKTAVIVLVPCSKGAVEKIEKAGGKVEFIK